MYFILTICIVLVLFIEHGVFAAQVSSCPRLLPTRFPISRSRSSITNVEIADAGQHRIVGETDDSSPRIVTGTDPRPTGDLKRHMVRLSVGGGMCTGSIINEKYVLTAAHCQAGAARNHVVFYWNPRTGRFSDSREVERVYPHPRYSVLSDGTELFDVMIMRIRGRAPSTASFITLNNRGNIPRPNTMARVAGFGNTVEGGNNDRTRLRQVDVPCRNRFSCRNFDWSYRHAIHICAGYKCGGCDSCQGDSGGPMFQFTTEGYFYQIGITSYGLGCARPRNPGVYVRISRVIPWIRSIVQNEGVTIGGAVIQKRVGADACPRPIPIR